MEGLLQKMGDIIAQNFLLGALIAFGAGFLTVFTPCSLTSIPLIVNYMSGKEKTAKKAAAYSIFICLGQAIVFVALGMVAASLGRLIHNTGFDKAWHIILALLTLWMALEMLGVTNVLHRKTLPINKSAKKGILGALGVGMLTAVFASPCSVPVFTAMLALVAASHMKIISGVILLLSYSLGHSIPLVAAGSSISFAQSLSQSPKFARIGKAVKIIFGILLLALSAFLVISAFHAH